MNKVKIAHILHSVGGVDVSLRLILENIDSTKFENIVIHGTDDTKHSYIDNNKNPVKEYKLPIQRNINLLKDFKAIYKTVKILRKEKPDIIHAHSAKGGIVAKATGVFLKTPVLHTPQAYSYLSANNSFKRNIYLSVEKLFSYTNNKILASSNSERNRAINEVGYKPQNSLLFNNSIEPISKIKELSIPKTWPDNYICSVGRPSYQKNIELMLDVLYEIKKHKNSIHLVLMGVGFHAPNLEDVKAKIKDLELIDNITLLEWTSREDIFNIVKHSELYLTTARYEGLPYAVIESLALGKPVVATDADGNRDLINNNENGFLIQSNDAKELANSVLKIINNPTISETFSKKALQLFLKNFDITSNIYNLEKIYLENIKN